MGQLRAWYLEFQFEHYQQLNVCLKIVATMQLSYRRKVVRCVTLVEFLSAAVAAAAAAAQLYEESYFGKLHNSAWPSEVVKVTGDDAIR